MVEVEAIKTNEIVYRPKTLAIVEYSYEDIEDVVSGYFLISSLSVPENLAIGPSPLTLSEEQMERVLVFGNTQQFFNSINFSVTRVDN
jgi:hypothetical protein